MYKLILTKSERNAIDWVGTRYVHGHDFFLMLMDCEFENDWDYDGDVTFSIPEHVAWELNEHLLDDGLTCFGPALVSKLVRFLESIV